MDAPDPDVVDITSRAVVATDGTGRVLVVGRLRAGFNDVVDLQRVPLDD